MKVLAGWPSIYYHDLNPRKKNLYLFNKIIDFFKEKRIEILGNPEDHFYEKHFMYDTKYHLNNDGAEINTDKIIMFFTKTKHINHS